MPQNFEACLKKRPKKKKQKCAVPFFDQGAFTRVKAWPMIAHISHVFLQLLLEWLTWSLILYLIYCVFSPFSIWEVISFSEITSHLLCLLASSEVIWIFQNTSQDLERFSLIPTFNSDPMKNFTRTMIYSAIEQETLQSSANNVVIISSNRNTSRVWKL